MKLRVEAAKACWFALLAFGIPNSVDAQTILNAPDRSQPVTAAEPEFDEASQQVEPIIYRAPSETPDPQDNSAPQNVVYTNSFGAWSVVCVEEADNGRECFSETSVFNRENQQAPVVVLRISPTNGSPTGLAMELSTPNNVLLQLNTGLVISGSTFLASYTICDRSYCTARVDISQPLLTSLLQNRAGFVTYTSEPSEEIFVPLEFGGLLDAMTDMTQQLSGRQG